MRLNGNLVFNGGGGAASGEIQNAYIERLGSAPPFVASEKGRIYFNASNALYYYNDGASWVPFATGGDASALQAEVDSLEASLGSAINNDGSFNPSAFNSPIASATSVTDAINQLASYATNNNTLAELDDVNIPSPSNGQYLKYDSGSSMWVSDTLTLSDVTDVIVPVSQINLLNGLTASASELNVLDGITSTTAELNVLHGIPATLTATELGYVDGVTSPIQNQLDGKQPLDSTLTALAAYNTNGIVVQNAPDSFVGRTLVAPAAGIAITNPDGVSGNPTFSLANDLAALEGLATTGLIVRTGDGTATTRTITGTTGNIVVADGDGVGGQPTIDLATVTQGTSGNFVKVTLDSYGRVVGNVAVDAADITALVDAIYVNASGDTMSGTLTMTGASTQIVLPNLPTSATHAANKAYVDSVAVGLASKPAVEIIIHAAADIAALGSFTYDNGTNGVGATITADSNRAFPTIDGITLTSTTPGENGVLVAFPNNTANAVYNGRYNLTQVGDSSSPWVLTRCGLCNESNEIPGAYVFVKRGTNYAGSGWVHLQGTDVNSNGVLDVGTDQIWLNQFAGATTYIAGTGLSLTGTTFNINLGAGIVELPSDEVGIDLYSPSASALILTTDGTSRSSATGAKLHLLLPAGSGLAQDATGLYIPANGITNSMILNSAHPAQADSGSASLDLGDTLHIVGVSTQGTSVSVNETVPGTVQYIVTVADASSSQKGVASFNATEFSVTSGAVSLGAVPTSKLSDNTINFIGTDASADTVTLGESFSFVDGGAATQASLVNVTVAGNAATISLRNATASSKGVASFDSNHFSVTAGAVSLNATLDDLTNVSLADSAATGDILRKTAGDWQPTSPSALAADISLSNLGDVNNTTTPTDGHVLVGNGTQWENQKVYHLHSQASASTTWVVNHGLGQQYCVVTVVDSTDNVIIPNSIVFDSASQLTVTFTSAITGKVVVMGVA